MAFAVAVLGHAAVLGVMVDRPERRAELAGAGAEAAIVAATSVVVVLTDDGALGPPPAARRAVADDLGQGAGHPLPRAAFESPGRRAAAQGGGGAGGPTRVTGRDDATSLAHEIWNHPDRYQLPRRETGAAASPESLIRLGSPGAGERLRREHRAAEGLAGGAAAAADAGGQAIALDARAWRDLDPRFDQRSLAAAARSRDGDVRPVDGSLLAERGAAATEAASRGVAADEVDAAAYSDAPRPSAIELSSPRAGGESDGVAGRGGSELAPRSSSRRGTGASARTATGTAATTLAERQDPYFRRMYARIDERVRYPRTLALALEQGEVVVELTLTELGVIQALEVSKSSGHPEFDREVARAMRAAGPFGTLPDRFRGRGRLRVEAPYTFSFPLVR